MKRRCLDERFFATTLLLLLFAARTHSQEAKFVFDANGNLFSQSAASTALPQITGQPQNRMVAPGEAASFFIVAADTRALTYEWRFNGVPIGGSATNEALLLKNVSTNHEGEYRVVLTNPSGSVTSAPAMLWIDSDADGLPDSWELANFGSLTNSATTDFDHDGSSNFDEFLNGTDPANSNSIRFRLTVLTDSGSVFKSPDQTSYTNGQSVTLTAMAFSNETFHAWLGDVVTRINPVTLVMTNNKTIQARFTPIAFVWTNRAASDWNSATNWTPNLVPGSNDSVVIVNASVTLNTAADCADFTLGGVLFGATLTGSGTLTIRGNSLWTQGTMTGSGRTVIEAGGTLNVANATGKGASLATRTLENGGTVFWTGGGDLALSSGAVITNRAGALFHVQNAAGLGSGNANGRFDNAGTFRKSVDSGVTTVSGGVSFNNSGAVEIQTGTLRLAGGGTNTGTFDAAGSTLVEWTIGSYTLNFGAELNGAGLYRINNATVTANSDFSVEALDLIAGTLNGTGTVTVSGGMNWTDSTMSGSGRTVIQPGATLGAAFLGVGILSTRVLENGGTILWSGAGSLGLNSSAVLTNRPGALFEIRNSASISSFGGGRFDNAGTVRKAGSSGTATIASGISFNNSGTVDIRSGILAANGGYTSTSGALLNCALGGTTPGAGYGKLQVGGSVTLNGALSVELINGFVPATNDTFAVVTAGTRNGAFASFSYPLNTVTMQLSNTVNSVVLRVTDVFTNVPAPLILPATISGTNITLTWRATSNVTYRVEFKSDLNGTNWDALSGDVTSPSNRASKVDVLTTSNRFYRVRVLP